MRIRCGHCNHPTTEARYATYHDSIAAVRECAAECAEQEAEAKAELWAENAWLRAAECAGFDPQEDDRERYLEWYGQRAGIGYPSYA